VKFVAVSPYAIGNEKTPIAPRNPSLPPLLVNPWQVAWIAPHLDGGCSVITADRSVMLFRESMEDIVRILTGDMH
jgi:hypothetical protein